MESLKKKGVDALLEATNDWNPYSGATYDELRGKADSHLAKQRKSLGKRSPRWYEFWRWSVNPCKLVGCEEARHDGHTIRLVVLTSLSITIVAWNCCLLGPEGFFFPRVLFTLLGLLASFVCLSLGVSANVFGLKDWIAHAKELDRMRSRMGHAEMLVTYMIAEVRKSRTALIGDDKTSSPLRDAQLKLAARLEEIQALAARLKASVEHENDPRLVAVLHSSLFEATTLECLVSDMKHKVDERISQIKAFFDECEARIHGLEAPVLVMAMSHELALHRTAAQQEMSEAEAAIADALFDLQAKWVGFQQVANTLLPQAVAKVFGETGGSGDETQNLAALEAAMDRVFDTLPALPEKPVTVS